MASRSIDDLSPACRGPAGIFLSRSRSAGFDLLVVCTLRTAYEQGVLYALGRTVPGRIVTWAMPGESKHQDGNALDVVPLINGKPMWSTKGADLVMWHEIGELGESAGLEWAGRWPARVREYGHFQLKEKK